MTGWKEGRKSEEEKGRGTERRWGRERGVSKRRKRMMPGREGRRRRREVLLLERDVRDRETLAFWISVALSLRTFAASPKFAIFAICCFMCSMVAVVVVMVVVVMV
jgi:hypothetical protein